MYGELADALGKAEQDSAVRAVLIQGDATIFSAGESCQRDLDRMRHAGSRTST